LTRGHVLGQWTGKILAMKHDQDNLQINSKYVDARINDVPAIISFFASYGA